MIKTRSIKDNPVMDDNVTSFKDAIVLPIVDKYRKTGGIVSSTGDFVVESCYCGDWLKCGGEYCFDNIDEDKYSGEDVIFLGFFIEHWGHYLVDCLGRLWALLLNEYKECKVVFLHKPNEHINGNYYQLLNYLGVDKSRIITIDKPTRFKTVFLPSNGRDLDGNQSPAYRKMLKKIVDSALSDTKYNNYDKVYLSRTKFFDASKKEIGELEIQKLFEIKGYKVLYPEDLSLAQQISIFNFANEVVCVNGTIPLNCIFSIRSSIILTVLNKTSLKHNNLFLALKYSKAQCRYIDVYVEPIHNHPKNLGEGPFWIEPNEELLFFLSGDSSINFKKSRNKIRKYIWYYKTYIKNNFIKNLSNMYHYLKKDR